ncbi:MAG: DUF1028 domain-containing protein [Hyphomicrobiales bacterium]
MTYTVIGRCPRTERLGIGIATYSITVGLYCNGVRANTGVTMSQAFVNQGNNTLALRLLEQGFGAQATLEQLLANDADFEYRQVAIVDREGASAVYTGPKTRGWSGHKVGPGYVATGNGLVGPHVIDAIAAGFEAEPDADLEHRLLMGIEAGRDAGGQGNSQSHKPERSAALIVHSKFDYADMDLRVDLHDTAVERLRAIHTEYKRYEAYYRDRGRNPRAAVPQDVFVANLMAGSEA